jgi:hypothetical protein
MSWPSLTPLRGGTVGIGMIAGRRRDLFADRFREKWTHLSGSQTRQNKT